MILLLLLFPLCALGVDFGGMATREGDNVLVQWTNVPPCSVIEWSADLNFWQAYSRLDCYACLTNYDQLAFYTKATNGREYWRLRGCAVP